jgi:hypothetical protein
VSLPQVFHFSSQRFVNVPGSGNVIVKITLCEVSATIQPGFQFPREPATPTVTLVASEAARNATVRAERLVRISDEQ